MIRTTLLTKNELTEEQLNEKILGSLIEPKPSEELFSDFKELQMDLALSGCNE